MYFMRQILALIFLLHGMSSFTYAQKLTISGYVKDATTGEHQPGVTVAEMRSRRHTISNDYGFFSLNLPVKDSIRIQVYLLGYQPFTWIGMPQRDTMITLLVDRLDYALATVEIKAETPPLETGDRAWLPIQTIKTLPALAGQTDVLRSFQFLPGIAGGAEGSSGLHIRGGSPDQNLVLMDDVPLYYANHLGGFLSVFNADAIQSVQVYKGTPPARFGGRLSGVTDVRLREGDVSNFKASLEVGLVSSSLLLEGPLGKKGNTSYLITGRRFNYDLILRAMNAFQPQGAKLPLFTFDDLNLKISKIFSAKDRVSFSFFAGSDRYIDRPGKATVFNTTTEDRFKLAWGNKVAAFRWHHVWNPSLFSNVTAAYNAFAYESDQYGFFEQRSSASGTPRILSQVEQRLNFSSRIRDASLRWDFEWATAPKLSAKFGAVVTQHWFNPNVSAYKNTQTSNAIDTTINPNCIPVFEPAVYGELIWVPKPQWNLSVGGHWAAYHVDSKTYSLPQPQMALSFTPGTRHSFHAALTSRQQGLHLLTGTGVGLPIDLWLPATQEAPPQQSLQMSGGWAWQIGQNKKWLFQADVFLKKLSRQIDFQEGASFFTGSNEWEEKIEHNGKGTAKGLEIFLEKRTGKVTGWLSYTLAKSTRQFPNINQGISYPYPYDRRHNTALVLQYKWRPNILISVDWVFSSGIPLTLPSAIYPALQPGYVQGEGGRILPGIRFDNALYYNRRNASRMPAYHRFDFALQFSKPKKHGERLWVFGAYNAYNRLNPFYVYYGFDKKNNAYNLYQFTLFPLIPSISYKRLGFAPPKFISKGRGKNK